MRKKRFKIIENSMNIRAKIIIINKNLFEFKKKIVNNDVLLFKKIFLFEKKAIRREFSK